MVVALRQVGTKSWLREMLKIHELFCTVSQHMTRNIVRTQNIACVDLAEGSTPLPGTVSIPSHLGSYSVTVCFLLHRLRVSLLSLKRELSLCYLMPQEELALTVLWPSLTSHRWKFCSNAMIKHLMSPDDLDIFSLAALAFNSC